MQILNIYIYSCIAFDIVIDLPRVTRGGPILVGPHPKLPKEVPYRSFEQSSRGLMMLIAHIIYNITNMVSYMPPIGSTCSHCLDIYIIYMCFCFPLRCFFQESEDVRSMTSSMVFTGPP